MANKAAIKNYAKASLRDGTADSGSMSCPGKGSVTIHDRLKISNLLHYPHASLNLLSVSQLCDLGLELCFDAEKCIVRDIRSNEIVLRGRRENNKDWNISGIDVCFPRFVPVKGLRGFTAASSLVSFRGCVEDKQT
jgi:hypothetical protein